ncbi:MAG: M67 family metallopeptidase [Acidobacteria bacterium]|nr:M67 family metallopeptidase [Acidobacteriota bacterium]
MNNHDPVHLSQVIADEMIAYAIAGLPNEACGLFSGPFGESRIERFHPMTNIAASQKIYELDGIEMMALERECDDAGSALLGVIHSHTLSTGYPSPTDVVDAARFDPFGAWIFIIVSLKHVSPTMRAYRIADDEVCERQIIVSTGALDR